MKMTSKMNKTLNMRITVALFLFQVLTNPHSPYLYRVNGAFANMPEFAQDWGCPAGSKMNPNKKCSVW